MRSLLARSDHHLHELRLHETIVIRPMGALTAETVMQFYHEVNWAMAVAHYPGLLVDMQKVEQIDSAGLMALISAFKLAKKFNKRFSLYSVSHSVRMILELTQLDRVLDIVEGSASMANGIPSIQHSASKEFAANIEV